MTMERELEGRAAWVTGAARGIGAATALALGKRGAHVLLTDVLDCSAAEQAVRDAGGTAEGARLDVTDRDACRRVARAFAERQRGLHILVGNAGICPAGTVTDAPEQWSRVMAVNLDGARNCVDAAWPALTETGDGRLVLVSSMAFYRGGVIVGTEYSASKAALIGMTRHLARNGGPLGLRCNAVAPGIIDTPMTEAFDKPDLEEIPLRRLGGAEDVAEPIAFLCGPGASYMTGTVLNVTGGLVLAA